MSVRFDSPEGVPRIEALVRVPTVYLDHCAIRGLADSPEAQARLLEVLKTKGTLFFSWVNAAELTGNRGASSRRIRSFLESVGCQWYPLDPNPWKVMRRATLGRTSEFEVCGDERVLAAYARQVGENAATLAGIVDLVGSHALRDSVGRWKNKMCDILLQGRALWENNPGAEELQCPRFDPTRPIGYVKARMVRALFSSGANLLPNDGADLSHAIVATAVSQFVVLDRRWASLAEQATRAVSVASAFRVSRTDSFLCALEAWTPEDSHETS